MVSWGSWGHAREAGISRGAQLRALGRPHERQERAISSTRTYLSMTAWRRSGLESFHSSKASSALSTARTMSASGVSGTRDRSAWLEGSLMSSHLSAPPAVHSPPIKLSDLPPSTVVPPHLCWSVRFEAAWVAKARVADRTAGTRARVRRVAESMSGARVFRRRKVSGVRR